MQHRLFVSFIISVIALPISAQEHTSKYTSEINNPIKSLTNSDLKGLEKGYGTPFGGMAKAAELNGLPGPRHVLDMKKEIALSSKQTKEVTEVYNKMKKTAISLGQELIQIESNMDKKLKTGSINSSALQNLVNKSAQKYGELRFSHLVAHLETAAILSKKQVEAYNKLRGYSTAADPCKNIPKGHPADMWKKHHGCE